MINPVKMGNEEEEKVRCARRDALGDGARGAADAIEPTRYLLPRADFREAAVAAHIEINCECFFVRARWPIHQVSPQVVSRLVCQRSMNLCCLPQGSAFCFPIPSAQLTEATIDPLASAPGAWGFGQKPLHAYRLQKLEGDWNHENP